MSTQISEGPLAVQLPSGTSLERHIAPAPMKDSDATHKLAICLHPWSWLGGRMDDPVLHTLIRPLHRRGYHVLRYNSRGVGRSSGWSSFTGSREAQDLNELVKWATEAFNPVDSIVIIGYSYGALIASLQPLLPEPRVSHVLLSYPLGARHWLTAFHGKNYTDALTSLIRDRLSNVLIIYGDRDEFTSAEQYEQWLEALNRDTQGERGSLQTAKVENATHFWREQNAVDRLVEAIESWLPT
ncbi:alpha/beta-hydrolase [Laetiporus sulphureus 93-53]|uniref:Alpha/beta-hydrolase n=1 Tax=Laetiporus sulphureus 93-53 TaxID=1314785 RepID=A0A165BNV4_9APHY|nr:alpha/beta-hydrolase [Laetiporus sulphureus 93-53]KZT01385.1 alpha/beta-hydrolase [Laetiporus sulphureus 93-53]